jgi:glycosyltransferase involved in cell wall biosynthesis
MIKEPYPEVKKEKILVIIPAFNEENQIAAVIQKIKKELPGITILVINDGSQDKTEKIALSSGAKVLSHPFNLGYGVALQTGYKYALKYDYDYVLQMDGDGQHDPRYLTQLLSKAKESDSDVVIGSRFIGSNEYQVGLIRRVGMKFFGVIASRLNRQKITDSTSGYQALSRRVIYFYTNDTFPEDYPDADVLIILHRKGFKIQEIPVIMHSNPKKHTLHSGFKPFYYVYKMLLSIILNLFKLREKY